VKAAKVNAGLTESSGKLLPGLWRKLLHVTCGLTACTPGSAPGPTLGNEYGKTLPFLPLSIYNQTTGTGCGSQQPIRGEYILRPSRPAEEAKQQQQQQQLETVAVS